MRKQKNSQDETAKGLLDWVRKGRNPATYLAGEGFANPAAALRNIKDYAKKHYSPEIVEEICRITLRGTKTAPAEPKPSENPPEEVKAQETVDFNGKEYEKMDKPSPTCCQPARQGGPIKWDDNEAMTNSLEEISMRKLSIKEEPITIKELKLRTLQGEMGTYEKLADDRMLFTGIPRPFTDCGYTVAEWFVLIEELQIAMQQLGLSK